MLSKCYQGHYHRDCCQQGLEMGTGTILHGWGKYPTLISKVQLLHESLSGFRTCHSAQDVLVSTVDDKGQEADGDKLVGMIMVDLRKVFDVVNHSTWHMGQGFKIVCKLPGWDWISIFGIENLEGCTSRVILGPLL